MFNTIFNRCLVLETSLKASRNIKKATATIAPVTTMIIPRNEYACNGLGSFLQEKVMTKEDNRIIFIIPRFT